MDLRVDTVRLSETSYLANRKSRDILRTFGSSRGWKLLSILYQGIKNKSNTHEKVGVIDNTPMYKHNA